MANELDKIVKEQAAQIKKMRQAVMLLERHVRTGDRKTANLKENLRRTRLELTQLKHVLGAR